ncbi:hypothetical protein AB1Y20_016726 [Prymnesium parvum]|uniref:Protein xylosyltransferase n=1 Tax=Prymnesium parvum TaxID=97485 RepID=A0AB34IC37_PRYPA
MGPPLPAAQGPALPRAPVLPAALPYLGMALLLGALGWLGPWTAPVAAWDVAVSSHPLRPLATALPTTVSSHPLRPLATALPTTVSSHPLRPLATALPTTVSSHPLRPLATALPTNASLASLSSSSPSSPQPPLSAERLATPTPPRCSVVFFHHLEKTGGTTLRSVLQRHAQLAQFDLISFVNRFDKLQFQMVLHRLDTLMETAGGLDGLRLAVEIHIGGHLHHPYFSKYTLPDLLFLRSRLRAKGCRCSLVSLLRHPLLQHLSWHYHFCNHRVPLCFWSNPPDCQARLAMGLTCHDGTQLRALTPRHSEAVDFMWRSFDLVGITELFDEFVLLLSDLIGLPHPAYRMQIVADHTLSLQQAQRRWTSRSCASLLASPPADLMSLIGKRMSGSAANALRHQQAQGRSSTGGPRGHMECRGYGPCEVRGASAAAKAKDMIFNASSCAAVTPREVLQRMCAHLALDETLYLAARARFEKAAAASPRLGRRVALLREAGNQLEARASAQASQPVRQLEAISGVQLQRDYETASGGGVPWHINELVPSYQAYARARFSCAGCSGDVVPEKDLIGCWPLWNQFAPDELRYVCNRTWTADPGLHDEKRYKAGQAPMPCWRTCWVSIVNPEERHCTPECPSASSALAASKWRANWDQKLQVYLSSGEGRRAVETVDFVDPVPMENFIYRVY